MAAVESLFLAGAGSPPDVSWSPYVWIVLVLVAAIVYVAFRMRAHRSKRAVWAGALVGLAIATIGTAVWGYHAVNVPFDDPSSFCSSPDPSPPSSVVADSILQDCAAGKTMTLSRGQTVAVVLRAYSNVDQYEEVTDFSVSDPNVVSAEGGSRYSLPGPPNGGFHYEVALFTANQPGEATISAVDRYCNGNLQACNRGFRWWVTIEVT
jgi:hypothetical protein